MTAFAAPTTPTHGVPQGEPGQVEGGESSEIQSGEGNPRGRTRWQFVWTVGVAFGIVVLQLGQGILLARLLGPEGRGQYATAVLYVQMLLYVGLCGGLEVICRHAAASGDSRRDRSALRRSSLRLALTTGLATTVIVLILNVVALPPGKRDLLPLAAICALAVTGQHVMLIMTGVDRGSGDFRRYNVCRLVAAAAFPLLLLAALVFIDVTVPVACGLFVLASLVSAAACIWGLKQPVRGSSQVPVVPLLRESRPYGVSMLATDLFERLDLLLVLWLAPLVEQGFYAAMVPAAYPLTVIPNTLGLFLFNRGADESKRLTIPQVHRILAGSLGLQAVMTLGFMLTIGFVVELLYGDAYRPAVIFALWLAPVSALKGVIQGLDSYLKGRGMPLAPIKARVVAMVVMVVATLVLFPAMGTVAVAIAALIGQCLCFVWLAFLIYADSRGNIQNADDLAGQPEG